MKQKWFNKAISMLLAVVLCVGMVPAMAIPAAAADLGSNEWVARNDDFSGYPTGTDTFWKNDKYIGFSNGNHGADGGDSYAIYNIVEENGNKMLELVSMNATANYFTIPEVSGAFSLSFDFSMKKSASSVPGLAMNVFTGMSPGLPASIMVYIEPYGVRLVESVTTGEKVETYVAKADGATMTIPYDTWYTVKMSVEPGKLIVKS